MIEKLFEIRDSLEKNWTYLHKILFTFSFYLLYKGFLKVLTPEQMSPFILIFLILGFLLFTIDILIYPIIDLFAKEKLNSPGAKTKKANLWVYFGLATTFFATVFYYITDYYPLVIVVIYSLIMAVLFYAYFMDYSSQKNRTIIKTSIGALALLGFAGVIHSFYLNRALNVNTFTLIFVLGFFVVDFLIYKWRVK